MSVYDPALPQPRRVAYALVLGEEGVACVAEDTQVLTRVVIFNLVAQSRPGQIDDGQLQRIRAALTAEDWQEAIVAWMDATGKQLNIFDDEPVWTDVSLDAERLRLELPLSPIFAEPS
ncbi:MAG: hypothetical protein JF887_14300 [Candidatus Dormibacteraeota bacterium]|uniref:Uncharacterized protein n=1 Tax=Candidatus Amunia macphersoniae TaxID=3127014 RepID=A0A934KRR8_9BACT|nr:hypothetical protein [Candidatus Dormibacteraeota bacterium]